MSSLVMMRYTVGVTSKPQKAGRNLRCQSGTPSAYSCPILSKLKRPSKLAR